MPAWTNDELNRIGMAEELRIASRRGDGTLRRPVTIWVVTHEDALYVRAVNGRTSGWFRGTQVRHLGHISAGGVDKDVMFEEVETDDTLNDQIDGAYRIKYRRYAASIIKSIISVQARAATIRLVPVSH